MIAALHSRRTVPHLPGSFDYKKSAREPAVEQPHHPQAGPVMTIAPDSSAPDQPPIRSAHPPRSPLLYRMQRAVIGAGLALCAVALGGGALILLLGVPALLTPLLLLFVAILAIPLAIGAVLTPPVAVTGDGLIVYPMFGPARFVPWGAIVALRPLALNPADRPLERLLRGRRNTPPGEGAWVLTRGALPVSFQLAAWLTGLGRFAVFGVSDVTHRDYPALLAAIRAHTGLSVQPGIRDSGRTW